MHIFFKSVTLKTGVDPSVNVWIRHRIPPRNCGSSLGGVRADLDQSVFRIAIAIQNFGPSLDRLRSGPSKPSLFDIALQQS